MASSQFLPCEKFGKNRALSNKPLPPVPLNNKEKCSSPGGRCPLDISPPRLISSTNIISDSWCSKFEPTCNMGKTALSVTESFSRSPEISVPASGVVASHRSQAACTHPHPTVDRPSPPGDAPDSQTKSPIPNDDVSVYSTESAGAQLHLSLLSPPNIPRIKLQRKATIKVAGSAVLRTRTAENRLKTYNKLSRHGSSARNGGRRGVESADRESTVHSRSKENEGYDAIYNRDAPVQKSPLTRRVTRRRPLRTTMDPRNATPRLLSQAQGNCQSISKATSRDDSEDRVLCDITNMFVGSSTGAETMHRVPRPPSRSPRHRPRVPAEFLQTHGSASQTSGMVNVSSQENARWHDNHHGIRSFHG